MDRRNIVMHFTIPPSVEDIKTIAEGVIEHLPEELTEFTESMALVIDEIPDEALQQELDLEDPYELVALYRSGKQISPGVESKVANDDDVMLLFRRPLLDLWSETCEDISVLVRQVMIEELGHHFEFSDREIDEMTRWHYQGML
jgi:predicted Zn-dependent protease with MMP-like domain